MISHQQLEVAADKLGLSDRPVMMHTSLRSFGEPIHGGANTIIDVLLARRCTILVPTFTEPQFGVSPPLSMRPMRNGIDYTHLTAQSTSRSRPIYSVDCGLINHRLGVLPSTLLCRADTVRGEHPLNSFAGIGRLAADLIAAQSPADVYAPIRELAHHNGEILLIGVGLDKMTALHLAEQQSGRRLFIRWARAADGEVSMVEVGSCSNGFPRLASVLHPHARTTTVQSSTWHAYPAKDVLVTATAAITADQGITHCPDRDCLLCRDSIAGGPISLTRQDEHPRPFALHHR